MHRNAKYEDQVQMTRRRQLTDERLKKMGELLACVRAITRLEKELDELETRSGGRIS
jgi:hypothetical protein